MNCDFSCQEMARYQVDLPYPEVKVRGPNHRWAALLSGTFASAGSELTAITQYNYHNFFTESYPEVHTALKYIAAVEIIHLNLLGDLIRRLGLKPIYATYETNTFWSGAYPDKSTEIAAMLEADIQGERDAIAHYKRIIAQIPDESINNLLRRIILDEEKHIEVLTPFYLRYSGQGNSPSPSCPCQPDPPPCPTPRRGRR